jgi:hypothetical protein
MLIFVKIERYHPITIPPLGIGWDVFIGNQSAASSLAVGLPATSFTEMSSVEFRGATP